MPAARRVRQATSKPPLYVSSSASGAGGGGTSLLITAPPTLAAGNLLIAVVYAGGAVSNSISSPGWTEVNESPNAGSDLLAVLTKIATGSEPANYTFSWTGGAANGAVILQYAAAAGTDGAPAYEAGPTGTTATIANVTASSPDVWLGVAVGGANGKAITAPAAFAARVGFATAGVVSMLSFDKTLTGTGPTGTAAATFSGSDFPITASILLHS